jgi:hypothetical protein
VAANAASCGTIPCSNGPVALLRRALYLSALLWALSGIALLAFPGFLLTTLLDQPAPSDDAWLRLFGVVAFVLALLMVLVGHRVDQLWWWCWAFVILEVGGAAVATLHFVFALPDGAAPWPWWLMAGVFWAFAGAFLWGIARAGVEAPPT